MCKRLDIQGLSPGKQDQQYKALPDGRVGDKKRIRKKYVQKEVDSESFCQNQQFDQNDVCEIRKEIKEELL